MKIFQLLNTLTKEEWRLLKKATQSPLYTTNPKVGQLLNLLAKQAPDFEDSPAIHRKHFKKLFPKEAFSENKLRKLTSNLTKVVEQLLLFQAQEKDEYAKQKRLNQIFQERGLTQLYQYSTNDLLAQLDARQVQDANYHQERFEVLSTQYFHPLHDKYDLKDNTLEQATHHLNTAFAIQQLRLALALKGREQVLNETPDFRFLAILRKEWEASVLIDNWLIELYLQALDLSEKTQKEDFDSFEKELFHKTPKLSKDDQQFLFMTGINYAVQQKNKDNHYFKSVPLKWYKVGLTTNLFINQQVMQESIFANIVINGCHEQQFDWVINFIDTYQVYLVNNDREAAILYYQSLVYYLQGNWEKTLTILSRNDYKSIYQPRSRIITIRALFEQLLENSDFHELLLANLQAFEAYIRRNESISKDKIIYYKNFILITRQLANRIYRFENSKKIKEWFEKYTAKNYGFTAKKWLSEKVANL